MFASLLLALAMPGLALALDQSAVPPKFPIPWGSSAGSAYIRAIPQASQIGITNCAASLTDGFPPLTFVPSGSGGCPPFGQDFNGILKQITQWSLWQAAGSPTIYDSAFSASIGGYPKGAALPVAAGPGCSWISTVDNNLSDPDTGGANWLNTCNQAVGGVLTGTMPNPGLAATGVTPGTYSNGLFTIGADGRITSAAGGALTINVKATNYTVATTDCGGVVYETGALATLTLPSISGFANGCTVIVTNGNASRAQVLSGFPGTDVGCGSRCLWPSQTVEVTVANGAWTYLRAQPARWYVATGVTLYVGPSGSCNNNNDGLAANAGGQLCSINTALGLVRSSIDSRNVNPLIQLACGSYTEQITYSGQGGEAADGVAVSGSAASPTCVLVSAPVGQSVAFARDAGILFIQNMEVACANTNSSGIQASQFATIDVSNVTFGSCDGHNMMIAQDGGHVDVDGGIIIEGNALAFMSASGVGSQFEIESQQITCAAPGSWSIGFFAFATNLSQILAPSLTFSGCGSITGQKYSGSVTSVIQTGTGNINYFPGSTPGAVTTQALYQ